MTRVRLAYYFHPRFDPRRASVQELRTILYAENVNYLITDKRERLVELMETEVMPYVEEVLARAVLPDYSRSDFDPKPCDSYRLHNLLVARQVAHVRPVSMEQILDLLRTEVLHPPVAKPSAGPEYWEPGFDPVACSMDRLRNILVTENVAHSSEANKETLVELVRDEVLPHAEAIRILYTIAQQLLRALRASKAAALPTIRYYGEMSRGLLACRHLLVHS